MPVIRFYFILNRISMTTKLFRWDWPTSQISAFRYPAGYCCCCLTVVAIGHGLLKKFQPMVVGCVLRNARCSLIWNYADPLTSYWMNLLLRNCEETFSSKNSCIRPGLQYPACHKARISSGRKFDIRSIPKKKNKVLHKLSKKKSQKVSLGVWY